MGSTTAAGTARICLYVERNVKMNPFNFRIQANKREHLRRLVMYSVTAVILTAAFAVGFIIVYVNSYNIISAEPMEVFGFYQNDDVRGIILFDHFFQIGK